MVTLRVYLFQMGLVTLTLVFLTLLRVGRRSSGYDVENYRKLPGVYLEHLGHASLSNTVWTIIVYAPIEPIDNETTGLERYVQYIEATCSRIIIRNWTACSYFSESMTHRLQHIRRTRQLLADAVQRRDEIVRSKRGLFNFVGS